MPPASLLTLAVMNPGPMTASSSTMRAFQLLRNFIAPSIPVPQHRDHVIRGDDAREAPMLVDDGERDQVVFVEERRDFGLRCVSRAGNVRLAQLRQLHPGDERAIFTSGTDPTSFRPGP